MATQRDIDERRYAVKVMLKSFADYTSVVKAIMTRYEVSDRTAKADIKFVRENWRHNAGDYLFDTRLEYEALCEMLGTAKRNGEAALVAHLSHQRSRLRKEMQLYERVQSSGLEDPGISHTLAAALSDFNGSSTSE